MKRYLLVLTLLALSLTACDRRDHQDEEQALAVIGGRIITIGDYTQRYREFRRQTGFGVPDTYQARREVLGLYVDEEVLIREAEKSGIAEDASGREEHERIEIQELLNFANREMVAKNIQVTESELKSLFVRLNTRLKARHLFAATRQQVDSLYAALEAGTTFEELAREVFTDPKLRDTGGDLGYFTVDEMEPAFEDAAFSLRVGKYSTPVKTSDGYSIIRVDDKTTVPIVTENEYAKHRHKLAPYWRNRKIKAAIKAFGDSLASVLNIRFDDRVLHRLAAVSGDNEPVIERPRVPNDPLENEILVTSELGTWHVRDFRRFAQFTDAKQRARTHRPEDLRAFVTGLLVRRKVLALATEAGLQDRDEYKQKVSDQWDMYLLTRMEEQLRAEMPVPPDSIRHYYEMNTNKFAVPAKINLREIVVDNPAMAELVQTKLQEGKSFAELARSYSIRSWSAERGGELGFLKAEDFGQWSELVFSMNSGDRKGPVRMDSMYVFLECIARRDSRPRSFREAKGDVENAVRYAMWDDYRKESIDDMRQEIQDLTVRTEKLKSLRIN